VGRAFETMKLLEKEVALLDLVFVKPLDEKLLTELAERYSRWYVFSDSAKMGGVGSAICEFLAENNLHEEVTVVTFEYEDAFIAHGNTKLVEESLGLLPQQLAKKII
jgi:1-deoxy-D-xylulose-5-phosphate synthase